MNLVINLNKPSGITSQQAVTKVKRLLGVKKAGHTGTLDPMATGVLLVCLNEATKISRFLLDMDKEYHARVKLGERTDTQDAEGRVLETKEVPLFSEADLAEVVRSFEGWIQQKPPMYSAVKLGGRTLYKLARKGIEIERPERMVEVRTIRISEIELPYFSLFIACSKGTYIRTLCEDIGLKIGTGAHLAALKRTRVGSYSVETAASFDDLLKLQLSGYFQKIRGGEGASAFHTAEREGISRDSFRLPPFLFSIDSALSGMKEVQLEEADYRRAKNGMQISCNSSSFSNDECMKLKGSEGDLFGIGRAFADGIRVERLLNL